MCLKKWLKEKRKRIKMVPVSHASKDVEKLNLSSLLMRMQTGMGSLENILIDSKTKLYNTAIMLLDVNPEIKNLHSHKNLYMNVYNSFIHNS